MKNNISLGDRMKEYENVSRIYLTRRMPVIIRIDGCHFHTFTKGMQRPFDDVLIKSMQETAKYLCENIMGCKLSYTQSDEISLLLMDDDNITTQAWFNKNLQKMCSISASMATMAFNKVFAKYTNEYAFSIKYDKDGCLNKEQYNLFNTYHNAISKGAYFDARAFVLPREEVCNYFYWRQQDASRNSIQMVGQANFSHKELQNKTCSDIQDMLMESKSINWSKLKTVYKRGSCCIRMVNEQTVRSYWCVDNEIPIFRGDGRMYIDKFIMGESNNGQINC